MSADQIANRLFAGFISVLVIVVLVVVVLNQRDVSIDPNAACVFHRGVQQVVDGSSVVCRDGVYVR